MNNCKHNIDESTCSYCNGTYNKLIEDKHFQQRERETIREAKIKYDLLKSKFESMGEDWEEDEYQILYDQLKDFKFKSSQWRQAIYRTAVILGRTRKSIVWHWKHMFILKDHSKAGKNLLTFKHRMRIGV